MAPIQYPNNDRARLFAGVSDEASRVRVVDERRRTLVPRLQARFNEINATTFGGKLPMPAIYVDESIRKQQGADGTCTLRRWAWDDDQRYEIRISSHIQDDPEKVEHVFAHEAAHHATFSVEGWEEEDGHGPRWARIFEAIRRGIPYQEPTSRTRPGRKTKRQTSSPVTNRIAPPGGQPRSRTGKVRATFTGKINHWDRPEGDQTFHVRKGQLIPADHWAVQTSPDRFQATA